MLLLGRQALRQAINIKKSYNTIAATLLLAL